MLKKIILVLSILFISATHPQIHAQNSIPENDPLALMEDGNESKTQIFLNIAKNIGIDATQVAILAPFIFLLASIAHESGHAVTYSKLFQEDITEPIQIHIGRTSAKKHQAEQLFSLGRFHFYRPHNIFINGTTNITFNKEVYESDSLQNKLKHIAGTAAGGLTASLFCYFILTAIASYCAYLDNKGFSEITAKSLIRGANPFKLILNTKNISTTQKRILINATLPISLSIIFNIFYACTPYILAPGDGTHIWKNILKVDGIPLKIAQTMSVLGCLSGFAWVLKQYISTRKVLLKKVQDKALKNVEVAEQKS